MGPDGQKEITSRESTTLQREKNHVAGIPGRPREKVLSRESLAANAKRNVVTLAAGRARGMSRHDFLWAEFSADFFSGAGSDALLLVQVRPGTRGIHTQGEMSVPG